MTALLVHLELSLILEELPVVDELTINHVVKTNLVQLRLSQLELERIQNSLELIDSDSWLIKRVKVGKFDSQVDSINNQILEENGLVVLRVEDLVSDVLRYLAGHF